MNQKLLKPLAARGELTARDLFLPKSVQHST